MTLVERFNRVESIAILCAHLISVKVLLSLPGCAIEEIHGCVEATLRDRGLATQGGFHRIVMIYPALVGELLS